MISDSICFVHYIGGMFQNSVLWICTFKIFKVEFHTLYCLRCSEKRKWISAKCGKLEIPLYVFKSVDLQKSQWPSLKPGVRQLFSQSKVLAKSSFRNIDICRYIWNLELPGRYIGKTFFCLTFRYETLFNPWNIFLSQNCYFNMLLK